MNVEEYLKKFNLSKNDTVILWIPRDPFEYPDDIELIFRGNDKDLEDYFDREVEEISVNETEDGLCLTLELEEE